MLVEKLLGPAIAQVQNALAAKAVVNGKSTRMSGTFSLRARE